MAAGISGDGLQRVRGISRGLRNNKKKAMIVTFELGLMGLAQQFEARGVRKWAGVTHNPGGQRISRRFTEETMAAVMLRPALLILRFEGI